MNLLTHPGNGEQKLKMIPEALLNIALKPSGDHTPTMPLPLWQP